MNKKDMAITAFLVLICAASIYLWSIYGDSIRRDTCLLGVDTGEHDENGYEICTGC